MVPVNFNPLTDTIPIIRYGTSRGVLYVRSDSPFKTFKDVMDFARGNPGKLTYGTAGVGMGPYIAMMGMALQEGAEISHVEFGGDGPTLMAVLGGHVMAGGSTVNPIIPQERAGKVRILAVFEGYGRVKRLSQWPTFYECGQKIPVPSTGFVIYGPKGLPEPIVKKLVNAFSKGRDTASFEKFALDNEVYPAEAEEATGQELLNFLTIGSKNCRDMMLKLGLIKTGSK
jgi:tripartite-type tricarboxylate transporter receptor subunit TctC